MRSWLISALAVPAAFAGLVINAPLASACGGCFSPPETVTQLDAHRMVISLSATQTTLWDQIQYEGSPSDFVWVLPVPTSDAEVNLAEGSFFDQLESQTAPRIFAPPSSRRFCNFNGFGAVPQTAAGGKDGHSDDSSQVTVFHQGVVGPYETVTIGSDDPEALRTWLLAHNYDVPDSTLPILADYIQRKSVFVALRLRPGAGVQQMQPVKVTYPGFMGTFPLKMVAVGASDSINISLWVVSDQRYQPVNFPSASIDFTQLTWNSTTKSSNYTQLFNDAIGRVGAGWVTEYAQPMTSLYFYNDGTSDPTGDVTAAKTGLRAPYVTRLRTTLYTSYLTQDLILGQSTDSADLTNTHTAVIDVAPPPPANCPSSGPTTKPTSPTSQVSWPYGSGASAAPDGQASAGCQTAPGSHGAPIGFALLALGSFVVLRRRRR